MHESWDKKYVPYLAVVVATPSVTIAIDANDLNFFSVFVTLC